MLHLPAARENMATFSCSPYSTLTHVISIIICLSWHCFPGYDDHINCEAFPEIANYTDEQLEEEVRR